MKIWIKRIILWGCVLSVMGMIFSFSSQNAEASAGTSDGLIGRILSALKKDFDSLSPEAKQKMIDGLSFAVRKAAHFSVYFLLGILCCGAVSTHTNRKLYYSSISMAISVSYAISDEIHQYFVPGRACRMFDVLIDAAGTIVGICVFISGAYLISLLKARRMRRRKVE